MSDTKVLNIYIVFKKLSNINEFIQYIKECKIKISGLEWTKANTMDEGGIAALITLRLPKKQEHEEVVSLLNNGPNAIKTYSIYYSSFHEYAQTVTNCAATRSIRKVLNYISTR